VCVHRTRPTPLKPPVAVSGAGVSRMCSGRGSFHRKSQVKSSQVTFSQYTNALVGLIGVITVPAVLLTLTLIYKSARGMGELNHDQERVGRPSLAFSRLVLSEERRVQLFPLINISLFHSPSRS
jgi:hypothetical protein